MGKDVDDRAARLAKHEAPDSPLLVAKRVRDLDALLHSHGVDDIDIGDLNRDTGRGHVVVADDGHLRRAVARRGDGHDPAHVHHYLETKQVHKEIPRLGGSVRPYVRDGSVDRHLSTLCGPNEPSYPPGPRWKAVRQFAAARLNRGAVESGDE